jgi:hypothetical protein
MADLLIRFRRPSALADGEATAWVADRAHARRAGLARRAGDLDDSLLLRVPVARAAAPETEERLARMVLDGIAAHP